MGGALRHAQAGTHFGSERLQPREAERAVARALFALEPLAQGFGDGAGEALAGERREFGRQPVAILALDCSTGWPRTAPW